MFFGNLILNFCFLILNLLLDDFFFIKLFLPGPRAPKGAGRGPNPSGSPGLGPLGPIIGGIPKIGSIPKNSRLLGSKSARSRCPLGSKPS